MAMAEVTDDDVRERFELDANGVLRWRKVWPQGGERFAQRAAERLNRVAGKAVPVIKRNGYSDYVVLYGKQITVPRVMLALNGEVSAIGAKGGVKSSGLPQGITASRGLYQTRIYADGKMQHLGTFADLADAVTERKVAEEFKKRGKFSEYWAFKALMDGDDD